MKKLCDIQGLLEAESPLEWAHDNLDFVDRGEHACIFRHPSDPTCVIRVSDYPDGWFEYVATAKPGPHVPRVYDIAHAADCFVALAATLSPIPDTPDGDEIVACARALISKAGLADLPRGAMKSFLAFQPGFEQAMRSLPARPTDLRRENFMMDGSTLVLNDPKGAMSYDGERRLKAEWAVEFAAPSP